MVEQAVRGRGRESRLGRVKGQGGKHDITQRMSVVKNTTL